ncbi:MAG: immunity 52 family protein [Pseudomonadota bacterium]|nr:immunity 52 family protein [Pseudomonadota bacterium]
MRDHTAAIFSNFVNGLPHFDAIYDSWLAKAKAGTDVFSIPLDNVGSLNYLNHNEMKNDLGEPWPDLGSRIWGGHAGAAPYDFRSQSYAGTSGLIGATTRGLPFPNHIFMRLSKMRPSTGRPWRASELRPVMKFTRSIWNPARMCAMFPFHVLNLPEIADPTWAAGRRALQPWIGWITYLPPDLAARAKVPADVEVETLEDGAALVTLCEEPFGKDDAEGLARLHALEAALRPLQT